ncbi:hypothetical protein EZS27_017011 [termite gut metagenome]|uniref:Uncharacterized protein n=1 Tax=termite gut metagenome TaxID=433724 RepID=A0A5J4RMC3_9ZZZZ
MKSKYWILTTCIVVVAVITYLFIGISNEISSGSSRTNRSITSYSGSSSNSHSSNSYSSSPNTNKLSTNDSTYSYSEPTRTESKYKGNQLKNGASPLDGCFGKGVYSGNATLTIKNGASSDAIVCLYSISSRQTIRNEYVQKNSSFKMNSIAQGYYKIRVFYGNDWNPNLENSCGTKGNFESNVSFSEFDGTKCFEDGYNGYTVATITLYTIVGGNASSSPISQSDFFRN